MTDPLPRTAAQDLTSADEQLATASAHANYVDTMPAIVMALIGVGRALTAMVRLQQEFYRELADVLGASAAHSDDGP